MPASSSSTLGVSEKKNCSALPGWLAGSAGISASETGISVW